jgi:two-component system response regulator HydG
LGNLRELKNAVFRLTLVTQKPIITIDLLKEILPDIYRSGHLKYLENNDLEERVQIIEALKKANNNKSKAAALLEIDRKTLYKRMALYKIDE